jgi:hypothetical protein
MVQHARGRTTSRKPEYAVQDKRSGRIRRSAIPERVVGYGCQPSCIDPECAIEPPRFTTTGYYAFTLLPIVIGVSRGASQQPENHDLSSPHRARTHRPGPAPDPLRPEPPTGLAILRLLDPYRSLRPGLLRTGRRHRDEEYPPGISRDCRQNLHPREIPPKPTRSVQIRGNQPGRMSQPRGDRGTRKGYRKRRDQPVSAFALLRQSCQEFVSTTHRSGLSFRYVSGRACRPPVSARVGRLAPKVSESLPCSDPRVMTGLSPIERTRLERLRRSD